VQHADHAGAEVVESAVRVVQVTEIVSGQSHRHRIDREIAATEVVGQRRGLHERQRSRPLVDLAACSGHVEGQLAGLHRGGPEPFVLARPAGESLGQGAGHRAGASLNRYVEVDRFRSTQQITYRAAHQEGRRQPLEGGQQPAHAGQATNALA
jgi:hypothetical protein